MKAIVGIREGHEMQRGTVNKFLAEETAAEVTELALVLAIIVAAAVALILTIGQSVQTFYQDTDAALP
jgi:Flp pilus assembly pilin Flp